MSLRISESVVPPPSLCSAAADTFVLSVLSSALSVSVAGGVVTSQASQANLSIEDFWVLAGYEWNLCPIGAMVGEFGSGRRNLFPPRRNLRARQMSLGRFVCTFITGALGHEIYLGFPLPTPLGWRGLARKQGVITFITWLGVLHFAVYTLFSCF